MKFTKLLLAMTLFLGAAGLLTGCDDDDDDNPTNPGGTDTVYDVAASLADYSTLVAAVDAAGLTSVLDDPNASFTVFAPDNAAFAALLNALGFSGLGDLSAAQLAVILRYHVLDSEVDAAAALGIAGAGTPIQTLGGSVATAVQGGNIVLDGTVTVVGPDAATTSNGIIHGIDGVLVPSMTDVVTTDPGLSSLRAAVLAADGAADTSPKVATALDGAAASGAYTLFAPNNAAFTALGSAPMGQDLTDVLLYHVLNENDEVFAADALGLASPTAFNTLLGTEADQQITVTGGSSVTIADAGSDETASVVTTDLITSNGVIHVINKVLLPGGMEMAPANVYEAAAASPDYSSLVAAIDKAGLDGTLQDAGATYTVFAPDNDAFAALLSAVGATSLDDLSVEQLTPILLYHVLGIRVESGAAISAAQNDETVTALGGTAQLDFVGGAIQIDGVATVEAADLALTGNGVVHGIDAVLLPSIADVATTDENFSNLVAALGVADGGDAAPGFVATLDDDAAELTVFAPTDAAFGALVTALSGNASTGISGLGDFTPEQLIPVLNYHVASGVVLSSAIVAGPVTTLGGTAELGTTGGVTIDGANVVTADILTSNGVIHVIDAVILPSVTDVASTSADFESLTAAVVAADLAETLDGAAPSGNAFTVFAPTDDAFANLLADLELADLSALITALGGTAGLTDVLLYHVVADTNPIYAADAIAAAGGSVPTLLTGESIAVDLAGNDVVLGDSTVEDATVIGLDLFTSNGVIHVIDKVLLPPTE